MIEKTDTSKIAKAVADEIELRNSQKEAEIKKEIDRRNQFIANLSVIIITLIAGCTLLYLMYTSNASRLLFMIINVFVGVEFGVCIFYLIDILHYNNGD